MTNQKTLQSHSFDVILDKSMAKALEDILEGVVATDDAITPDEQERISRLRKDLADIGIAQVGSDVYKSVRAEIAFDIQQREDFKLFRNAETNKPYEHWTEFRDVLASALRVHTSTLQNHIKLVRIGREVLGIEPGRFPFRGGITTVGHIKRMTEGHDGREEHDLSVTIRPKTKKFKDALEEEYPGDHGYDEMIRRYYYDKVAHDYNDPAAINKDSEELAATARDELGEPDVRPQIVTSRGAVTGYRLTLTYPDYEDDGVTVMGEAHEYSLEFQDAFIPPALTDWIHRRFGVRRWEDRGK